MADRFIRMPSRPNRDDSNPEITAILRAMRAGDAHTLDQILSSNTNFTYSVLEPHGDSLLTKAAQEGHGSIVDVLVRHRADPNLKRQDGWTPLQLASSLNHTSVLERLIDAGAAINAKNRDGWTALMLASQHAHAEATRLLINGGALLEIEDKRGNTALMISAQYGAIIPLRLLLLAGAKTDHFNHAGMNTLMLAAICGRVDSVQSILNSNVNINARNQAGHTALMVAASNGRSAVVGLLLTKKAAINFADNDGWTALMHAASQWHVSVVETLLQARADPFVTSVHGDTALRLAESHDRKYPQLGDVTQKPRVRDLEKDREKTIELLTAALGSVAQRGKHTPALATIRSPHQPSPHTLAGLPRTTSTHTSRTPPKQTGGGREGKGSGWDRGEDERSDTMSLTSVESGTRERSGMCPHHGCPITSDCHRNPQGAKPLSINSEKGWDLVSHINPCPLHVHHCPPVMCKLCKKSISSAEALHIHVLKKHIQRPRTPQEKWSCPYPHPGHTPKFPTEKQLSFHLYSHTKAHIYRCRKCGTCLLPHGTAHPCNPIARNRAVVPLPGSKGPSQTPSPSLSNTSSAISIPDPNNDQNTARSIPKTLNISSTIDPKECYSSEEPSPELESEEQITSEWAGIESENDHENTANPGYPSLEEYMNGDEFTENEADTGNFTSGKVSPETAEPAAPIKETRSVEVQTDDVDWTVREEEEPTTIQKEEGEIEDKEIKPIDPFWGQLAQGGEQVFGSMDARSQSLIVYLVQEVMSRDKLLKEREERLVHVSQSVMDVLKIDPGLSGPLQGVLNALLENKFN